MSYCRFSEGDVYVIGTIFFEEQVFLCYCGRSESFYTPSRSQMLLHLRKHESEGLYIPARAFSGLASETEWGTE